MAHALGYLSGHGGAPGRGRRARRQPALLLVLFVALAAVLGAQPAAPEQAVRFTVFAAKPIEGLAFVPRAKAAPQKIVFYPTARSPRYEFRGAMPLRFVEAATGKVAAEVTVPPELREVLLLFSALPENPKNAGALRYQVAVLDDGAARRPAGTLAILNLSGLALAGSIGDEKVTLGSGLNPPRPAGRATAIALRTTFKNRSYAAYSDTVPLGPRQRALLILFPPFYAGSLEVQSRLLIDEPGR